jgi:cobalt/nickel transport system permease protein
VLLGFVPFVLLVPWTVPRGTILWEWRWLHLTDAGLAVTATLVLKGLTITVLMLTLLASGPFHTLLTAAGKLGVPRVLVQVTLLTYRYVFVLVEELQRLRVALRVRAFRNRLNAHSLRTIGQVTGTLLVRGSDRAERVAHAMRCRGYTGHCRTLQTFRTTWRDPFLFLWLVGSMAALVVWERCG